MSEMGWSCAERLRLHRRLTGAIESRQDLEKQRTAAIRDGDTSYTRFDARIEQAVAYIKQAQREFDSHLREHGCS